MDFSNGDSFEKHAPDLGYIHALTLKSEKHESWPLNNFVGELCCGRIKTSRNIICKHGNDESMNKALLRTLWFSAMLHDPWHPFTNKRFTSRTCFFSIIKVAAYYKTWGSLIFALHSNCASFFFKKKKALDFKILYSS